jgi:hypothetical protein
MGQRVPAPRSDIAHQVVGRDYYRLKEELGMCRPGPRLLSTMAAMIPSAIVMSSDPERIGEIANTAASLQLLGREPP